MKPRPRIRKFFKWGGLVVSGLLLTVWVGSCWRYVEWDTPGRGWIAIAGGQLIIVEPLWGNAASGIGELSIDPVSNQLRWSFRFVDWVTGGSSYFPLWLPALICMSVTAAAWRMDIIARRKSRLGKCPACGYDRTGLAPAAPCPECNAKA
jgi:hypothetical protein